MTDRTDRNRPLYMISVAAQLDEELPLIHI